MTRLRFVASAFILLCTLAPLPSLTAQDNHDKNKDKQQNHGKHAGPADQPKGHADPPGQRQQKPGDNGRHLGQLKQMDRSPEQVRDQQRTQKRAWQERRANHWEYEHRTWRQRGGYNGYRVPDDYFRDHYGNGHAFRIYGLPFRYEAGNPRFQYGGYWFTMLDPYPENWGGIWYETDDVYVVHKDDGYYLFNHRYPSDHGIAVSVSL